MVLQELEAQLKTAVDVCTCQDCVLDMAAYALNNVKPAYRVSLMGSVYARAGGNPQLAQGIARAVREGIAKVKANPSHD
jgi:competence protein ComFB